MKYINNYTWFYAFAFALLLGSSSCSKENRDQNEIDREIILEYIEAKNLDALEHPSGIFYIITQEGNGEHPGTQAKVTVRYKGTLTNGTVFDQTPGTQTANFDLPDLIDGWRISIPLLSKGGKGTFIVPSSLAYGNRSVGPIPSNSVLVFDIQLVSFVE